MIVQVNDHFIAATPASVTLPVAPPMGTILFVGSSDPDGLLVNGVTLQPSSRMRMWIFTLVGCEKLVRPEGLEPPTLRSEV